MLEAAIARYGAPEHLRSDNGPEFIAYAIQDWLKERQIKTLYIRPGSPWENGHIESFHDKLRDECLNRELFGTLAEARVIVESWRVEYTERRPHSSLGYQTPGEFARRSKFGLLPASGLLPSKLAKINQAPACRFRYQSQRCFQDRSTSLLRRRQNASLSCRSAESAGPGTFPAAHAWQSNPRLHRET